jgi:hypothetical protein
MRLDEAITHARPYGNNSHELLTALEELEAQLSEYSQLFNDAPEP